MSKLAQAEQNSGQHSFEYRLMHLFLFFAATDGELSEKELTSIAIYMKASLEKMNSQTDLKELMLQCLEDMKNQGNVEVLKETIQLFAQHIPKDALQTIVTGLEDAAAADGLAEAEAEMFKHLKQDWGIS